MEDFGLDQKINGLSVAEYISRQLEDIEKKEVELEKEKIKKHRLQSFL